MQEFLRHLPGELKEFAPYIRFKKVEVFRTRGVWRIYLELTRFVPERYLRRFCQEVRRVASDLHEVELEVRYCLEDLTLEEFCQTYWDELVEDLNTRLPGSKGWLSVVSWTTKGDTLTLKLPNEVGVQFLLNKRYPFVLSEYFGYILNRKISVNLEVSPDLAVSTYKFKEKVEYESVHRLAEASVREKQENLEEREVLFGKKIKGEAIPLASIDDEEKNIVVQGYILEINVRELRSGRKLITLDISDNTDSITVKIFDSEEGKLIKSGKLVSGQWIKVRGSVQFDRFMQELIVMADDVNLIENIRREDRSEVKRVELHLHTKMSAMDGLTGIREVVQRAALWGHPAIAITDHGVVQAFPEAYAAGKEYGVKIIYGLEGYLFDDEETNGNTGKSNYHVIILVRNQTGLTNLYRLVTLSHLQYFHRRPRIPKTLLGRYREGLIIGTACEAGELIQRYLAGARGEELEEIARFYDYLEIQPLANNEFLVRSGTVSSKEELKKLNLTIVELGEKLNKPVVATGDVHFLDPEDAVYRQILMAGSGYEDETQAPLYYRTTEDMLEEFSYLGQDRAWRVVVETPNLIASMVEEVKPIPDEFYPPRIDGAEEQIREMAWRKAREIYGDPLPEIVEKRVKKELDAIINNGFAVLYLIAHKLVTKSNQDGYLVGSRGSVGSSLVATLTGITEVNPLPPHYICPGCHYSEFITDGSVNCGVDLPRKNCPRCGRPLRKDGHDIPFEVFMGFKGDKVPDIDLNFSGEYQARAHKYVEELFGRDRVYRAGTIATIAERTAFGFVKNYLEEKGIKARNAEINRLVRGCTGVKRTTGQHPGGLMVVPKDKDIHEFTPLQRPADDPRSETVTTHFDYHAISSRLVKLDILGHDDPTVIKMLEDMTGVSATDIPLDDPETIKLFSGVEVLGVTPEDIRSPVGTYGIPEYGTRFVRQMLEETKPKTFSELVRISGFSHGTDVWLNNAQELIRSGTARLSEAISTRDDIMTYLIYKGVAPDLAFKIMEDVRKGRGLKPEYEEAMKQHEVPAWFINSCKKIKYLFPKAHAVAYVTMAFRIAYFKVWYPEAFYASFFTVRADEFDADLIVRGPEAIRQKIEEIEARWDQATAKDKNLLVILEVALEMYQRGIKLLKVDLERSEALKFKVVGKGVILPPFAALQGIGKTAAENIVRAREQKPFSSINDLRIRARISKTVLEILSEHGCLEGLPETRQLVMFQG